MFKLKGYNLIEVMIVIAIIGIFAAIFFGAKEEREHRVDEIFDQYETDIGRIKNPDGTPVRPSNDQIRHYSNAGTSSETNIGNTVEEQCIDRILYLFVTKNGKDYMAPKEDTFGYNVKCSE